MNIINYLREVRVELSKVTWPTRAEATKWLPKVKSVKGAEQSWITQ